MPKITPQRIKKKPSKGIALVPIGVDAIYGYTTISIEDVDLVKGYHWGKDGRGYVRTSGGCKRGTALYMHKLLCPVRKGYSVDHKNRDILDNRRSNLREATPHMQSMNRVVHSFKSKNRTSDYKGVCLVNRIKGKPWQYALYSTSISGGRIYGYVATEKEAALKYNKLAKKYHGELAVLNEVTA